ncbi:CAAX amino terminal protease self- immunity [Anaerotignum neopropionicum]|uniref:CAAX amino terminal protease self-immunity n=1 Tax=Anaerotignum neopropionicum TaxID=36847 RepID=A0A136WI12_9FIRM|nr:type II CAAX endopeptidase family protein [Anaerotignum neopropionicum]KXL54117.1 CAAX amino terminal protease self- immunity [Anaerotignum neopropionicum]
MKKENKNWGMALIMIIYVLCFVFRGFEYMILRTDRTIVGEAFIHKLMGIVLLFWALRYLCIKGREIGFTTVRVGKNIAYGLLLGLLVFIPAYGIELFMQYASGNEPSLNFFVTSYGIQGNLGNHKALLFYFLCIMGNIINVIMEEGVFRGLFLKIAEGKYSFFKAAVLSSVLFGFWHIAAPLRSFLDGEMQLFSACMAMLSLGVMSGVMGLKLCMLTKIFGNLWVPMADHFFNNTIINLLHITALSGADQMQVMRIALAQTLSFMVVLFLYWKTKARQKTTFREA